MLKKPILVLSSIAGLIACLAAHAFAQAPAKEAPLLSIATKVATLDNVSDDAYFWVSDHSVLFFRFVPTPMTQEEKKALSADHSLPKDFTLGYFEALLCDIKTGETTPMAQFNSKFAASVPAEPMIVSMEGEPGATYTAHNPPSCAVSPDGQWFLWRSANLSAALQGGSNKPVAGWSAAKLDGSAKVNWPFYGEDTESDFPCWESDKHHWVALYEVYTNNAWHFTKAVIKDINDPSKSRQVAINASEQGLVKGLAADGAVLVVDQDFHNFYSPPKIEEFSLDGSSATRKVFEVQPPARYLVQSDAALSPDGNRLAWIFARRNGMADDGYLLCISDSEGSHMQAIGSMPGYTAPKEVNHHSYYFPQTLRWTPDGKLVSFIFRDALYTVPAP